MIDYGRSISWWSHRGVWSVHPWLPTYVDAQLPNHRVSAEARCSFDWRLVTCVPVPRSSLWVVQPIHLHQDKVSVIMSWNNMLFLNLPLLASTCNLSSASRSKACCAIALDSSASCNARVNSSSSANLDTRAPTLTPYVFSKSSRSHSADMLLTNDSTTCQQRFL